MSENILCEYCGTEISKETEFCLKCGTMLIDDLTCFNHPDDNARGVCVICQQAYCKKCGLRVNGVFLCDQHSDYEIYEGMARVFGSSDEQQVNYFKSILEENNLHPFIYARNTSPLSVGGVDYSLFNASGNPKGKLVNEIKLMVPCSEFLQAEKIINELEHSTEQ
ncbi:MAG: zinc-ribbon domain-containing protein [Ignavibacteriaceae bacterium]|nr:zinc-ribbon domain-containing protein [Ignavibacteriaceae bacterium]